MNICTFGYVCYCPKIVIENYFIIRTSDIIHLKTYAIILFPLHENKVTQLNPDSGVLTLKLMLTAIYF